MLPPAPLPSRVPDAGDATAEPPRRIAVNASWLLADRVLRMGVGLVVGVLIARHLGVADFGLLNYATALVGLLSGFSTLGLESILVRDLVQTPDRRGELLGTAAALRLGGAGVCTLLAVAIVAVMRPGDTMAPTVVGLVALATVFQASDVVDLFFQARAHTRPAVLARLAAFGVATAARCVLLVVGAGVTAFAVLVLVEAALTAAALIGAYAASTGAVRELRVRGHEAGRLVLEGWPLLLSGMAIMLYMRIDVLMLEASLGLEAVGIYGGATRISEAWYFVPTAIAAAAAPSIAAVHRRDPAAYQASVRRLLDILAAIALAAAVVLSLLSAPIVGTLLGREFAASAPVLAVHAWAGVFVALGVGQGTWNVCEGLTRLALVRTLGGAALNIALNLVLIPRFGVLGAAFATVVSFALSAYVLNAFDRRTRVIFRMQTEAMMLRVLFAPRGPGAAR
jgi:PST family polysaccharide transporter